MTETAHAVTEAERLFPDQGPARAYRAALDKATRRAAFLWSDMSWLADGEDKRIAELEKFCIGLAAGDVAAGRALAEEAIQLIGSVLPS